MSYSSGMAVQRGMKTQMRLSARGELVDRAVYGPMAADETHIAGGVEHCKLFGALDGRRDGVGDRYKVDLVNLALRKKGRPEDEWARREQTRWLGDCERTWRSVLKVVVQRKIHEHESLCSLPVRLGEDEYLHCGILRVEA